jgi:hypothetical protein
MHVRQELLLSYDLGRSGRSVGIPILGSSLPSLLATGGLPSKRRAVGQRRVRVLGVGRLGSRREVACRYSYWRYVCYNRLPSSS